MSNASVFPARLTDEVWAILEPLVPANKPGGRPPKYSRAVVQVALIGIMARRLAKTYK